MNALFRIALGWLLVYSLSACDEVAKVRNAVSEVWDLRKELAERTGSGLVQVKFEDTYRIEFTITNSDYNDKTPRERREFINQMAPVLYQRIDTSKALSGLKMMVFTFEKNPRLVINGADRFKESYVLTPSQINALSNSALQD